jgi:hypothetical protein
LYRWSADQIDPKHRFDEWREVRSRGLFGVTAELEAEQRANFTGEFACRPFATDVGNRMRWTRACREASGMDADDKTVWS